MPDKFTVRDQEERTETLSVELVGTRRRISLTRGYKIVPRGVFFDPLV